MEEESGRRTLDEGVEQEELGSGRNRRFLAPMFKDLASGLHLCADLHLEDPWETDEASECASLRRRGHEEWREQRHGFAATHKPQVTR
ncbi:hypothetical protein TGRH88_068440 [Toxoplasma gondii]|uniref:Uncharacterized protein n=1 Tax=Toxoplasma gondii TaxID=5811 RepID=A0A7J6K0U5_TOXGO|nr:hypothetical protein TGRH88_068440 [Toxoplasma gondii]